MTHFENKNRNQYNVLTLWHYPQIAKLLHAILIFHNG